MDTNGCVWCGGLKPACTSAINSESAKLQVFKRDHPFSASLKLLRRAQYYTSTFYREIQYFESSKFPNNSTIYEVPMYHTNDTLAGSMQSAPVRGVERAVAAARAAPPNQPSSIMLSRPGAPASRIHGHRRSCRPGRPASDSPLSSLSSEEASGDFEEASEESSLFTPLLFTPLLFAPLLFTVLLSVFTHLLFTPLLFAPL